MSGSQRQRFVLLGLFALVGAAALVLTIKMRHPENNRVRTTPPNQHLGRSGSKESVPRPTEDGRHTSVENPGREKPSEDAVDRAVLAFERARDNFLQQIEELLQAGRFQEAYDLALGTIQPHQESIEDKARAVFGIRALPALVHYLPAKEGEGFEHIKSLALNPAADPELRIVSLATIAGLRMPDEHWQPHGATSKSGEPILSWLFYDFHADSFTAFDPDYAKFGPGSFLQGNFTRPAKADAALSTGLLRIISNTSMEDPDSFSSPSDGIRPAAVTLLSVLGNRDHFQILSQVLELRERDAVRLAAAYGLKFIAERLSGNEVLPRLVSAATTDPSPRVRSVGLSAVSDLYQQFNEEARRTLSSSFDIAPPSGDSSADYVGGAIALVRDGTDRLLYYYVRPDATETERESVRQVFATILAKMSSWPRRDFLYTIASSIAIFGGTEKRLRDIRRQYLEFLNTLPKSEERDQAINQLSKLD